MSEKRFKIIDDDWLGIEKCVTAFEDNVTKTVYFVHNYNVKGVVDLLNQLSTKCRQLEKELEQTDMALHRSNLARKKLEDENEQLRKQVQFFTKQEDEFEQYTAQTIQNMIADYRDDDDE